MKAVGKAIPKGVEYNYKTRESTTCCRFSRTTIWYLVLMG
jgi:non-ribosomal peptide synthetase component E (peptide arylation enzyme)